MKKMFIHFPLFRLVAPAVYGLLSYLIILLINNNLSQIGDIFMTQEVYVLIALTFVLFESTRVGILLMNKWSNPDSAWKTIAHILTTTVCAVLLASGLLLLYFRFVLGFGIGGNQLVIFVALFIFSVLLYHLFYFSNYYLNKEKTMRIASEKQQAQVLEAEMMEFRNEINPTLLFESLENLINLIYKDADRAEDYIDHLAIAYRYVLTNRGEELVPVSQEIEAVNNLIHLLNEGYFGQLRWEVKLEDCDMGHLIIPGSLPALVEAIVRNTIISRYEPLHISCFREDDYLTIQSKLNDRLSGNVSSNEIVERLQRSYALFSDQPMIKVKAYNESYIKLPFIKILEESVTT